MHRSPSLCAANQRPSRNGPASASLHRMTPAPGSRSSLGGERRVSEIAMVSSVANDKVLTFVLLLTSLAVETVHFTKKSWGTFVQIRMRPRSLRSWAAERRVAGKSFQGLLQVFLRTVGVAFKQRKERPMKRREGAQDAKSAKGIFTGRDCPK